MSWPEGPPTSPLPIPKCFSPPFPAAVSQRGHSHLPQQTKNSQRISVSSGQRSGIGTPRILTPFHIQAFFWEVTWSVFPVTWFQITWGWQFCFTTSGFIIFHLESFFPWSGTSHGCKKLYICRCLLKCGRIQCISQRLITQERLEGWRLTWPHFLDVLQSSSPISYLSHLSVKLARGTGWGQSGCMRGCSLTRDCAGQEANRSVLGVSEQMASLAEPMAETCNMPGNWFQQHFLG